MERERLRQKSPAARATKASHDGVQATHHHHHSEKASSLMSASGPAGGSPFLSHFLPRLHPLLSPCDLTESIQWAAWDHATVVERKKRTLKGRSTLNLATPHHTAMGDIVTRSWTQNNKKMTDEHPFEISLCFLFFLVRLLDPCGRSLVYLLCRPLFTTSVWLAENGVSP